MYIIVTWDREAVSRQVHILKIVGATPTPATKPIGGNIMFKNDTIKAIEAVETQLKLMREDNDKMRAQLHTLTKHVKFLVHMVKVVNPELKDPTED